MKIKKLNIQKDLIKRSCLGLFLILFSFINAQDSLKTNYDLNDPRNPQCPCHKYQKQADEEFKKLLASANKKINNGNSNVQFLNSNSDNENENINAITFSKIGSSNNNSDVISKNHFTLSKHKHKKRVKHYSKFRRAFDVKNWQILKRSRKLNSCFHWK